ncbi:unnamed protein product, partial [Protopolystoma xenopodis]
RAWPKWTEARQSPVPPVPSLFPTPRRHTNNPHNMGPPTTNPVSRHTGGGYELSLLTTPSPADCQFEPHVCLATFGSSPCL